MAIYKMVGDKDKLDKVEPTSFGQEGVLERSDLQRMLRDQPDVLEEGLLIISEEFGNWQDSNRRIDLLGLDASGRLVVIELKRGETGEHMDLQAIRYAAMVSTITLQQVIDAHQSYLDERGFDEVAEERISDHLENHQSRVFSAEKPRIILVSEGFSSELTTCALWLNESGLDVTCIRMQPHQSGPELLVETSQIIPLPEANEYLIRVREREEEQIRIHASSLGQRVPGSNGFKDSIEKAEDNLRPKLTELCDWATKLEQEGLVELASYIGKDTTLQLRVPRKSILISVYNQPDKKTSAIVFWTKSFRENAPGSASSLDEVIGTNITNSPNPSVRRTLSKLPDDVWSILTEAYREANGLPVGDEAPDG